MTEISAVPAYNPDQLDQVDSWLMDAAQRATEARETSVALRRLRDRALGTRYPAGTLGGTLVALAVGVVAWAAFAFWLHAAWIGIAPFARAL